MSELWVAVGALGSLATSTDGTTWTQRTSSFDTTAIWGVAWSAAPPGPSSPFEVFTGATWEPLTLEVFDGTTWQPLALEVVE